MTFFLYSKIIYALKYLFKFKLFKFKFYTDVDMHSGLK